jgi:hypothetical protein
MLDFVLVSNRAFSICLIEEQQQLNSQKLLLFFKPLFKLNLLCRMCEKA